MPSPLLLEDGLRFKARNLELWEDCGTIPALLEANRHLLDRGTGAAAAISSESSGSVSYTVIPPVSIAPDAHIERSVIGPHVTVASGVYITDSVVSDSIVQEKTRIETSLLTGSVIGRNTRIKGSFQRLNVGDDSQIG